MNEDVILVFAMGSDGEIIDAVLRGDVDQFAELVKRYQQTAWRVAYGFVGNAEDAKEISQIGFVKAYQRLRQFRRDAKFSTWLYRIVANECKDFFKRKARQPRTVPVGPPSGDDDDPPMFEVDDPAGDPRELAANRELASRMEEAIGLLADHQRTAFVLHHLNGLPLDEVANVMGCRVGTVKSHLFRACEHLRRRLGPSVRGE